MQELVYEKNGKENSEITKIMKNIAVDLGEYK